MPQDNASSDSATSTAVASSTSVALGPDTSAVLSTTGGGYTVTSLPVSNTPATPEYTKSLVCTPSVPAETCTTIKQRAAAAAASISKNKLDVNAWIILGNMRKQAGDYTGAAAAWQYVSIISPTNIVSFNNLGDLYMNFLKDYPKAESNYLIQIKNKSDDANAYRSLFTLYSELYKKGTSSAEDILKKGIVANTKAIDLQVTLADYYKSQGRTAEAKAAYEAAIKSAQSQGQTSLAAQIQQETN